VVTFVAAEASTMINEFDLCLQLVANSSIDSNPGPRGTPSKSFFFLVLLVPVLEPLVEPPLFLLLLVSLVWTRPPWSKSTSAVSVVPDAAAALPFSGEEDLEDFLPQSIVKK